MNKFDETLSKMIDLIIKGMENTEDEKQFEMYESILEYIGILIGLTKERLLNE